MFDALIIGGGPAGATAARLLAGAGWHVGLVEQSPFPRRKVCGEFLSAASLEVLRDCGVAAGFLAAAGPPVRHVGLYADDTVLLTRPHGVLGHALGREHLDCLMLDAAVAAGATLFQPVSLVALAPVAHGHDCTLQTGDGAIVQRARIVIAAGGSWAGKAALRLAPHKHRPLDLMAFKAHFCGGRLPGGLMPLLAFPGGYGGMVNGDGGRLSLSCCIRRDTLEAVRAQRGGRAGQSVIAHIRATTRGADEALRGAVVTGPVLAAGPILPGIRPRYRDGVFFTGNSAGEAHPVIAEGISMAIQGSALLTKILIATGPRGDLERAGRYYTRAWRWRFSLRIHAASLFAAAATHDLPRMASLALLRRCPRLIDWGARISGKPVPV